MRLTIKTYTQNYHAFGSVMAGRSFSNANYRFKWNGKEAEPELFEGCLTFEARIFDNRICRWLSTDPREGEYAWQSTYAYFSNSPISIIDFLGMGENDPPKKVETNVVNFGDLHANPDGSKNPYINDNGNRVEYTSNDDMWNEYMKTLYLTPNSREKSLTYLVDINKEGRNVGNLWQQKMLNQYNYDNRIATNYRNDQGIKGSWIDNVQTGLDVVGFEPGFGEIADGVNVLIYLIRCDFVNAGLSVAAMVPFVGIAATGGKFANKTVKLSDTKSALKEVHKIMGGSLPKGTPGKFGSPQRGTTLKGYRLDPAHPGRPLGHNESVPHINYLDYTNGNSRNGGISGAIPIIKL